MLLPVLHLRGTLSPEHERLLDDALRRGRYAEDDRLALSVAVLAFVTALSHERPLVCVVDDAQWVDPIRCPCSLCRPPFNRIRAAISVRHPGHRARELSGLPRMRLAL